MNTKEEEEEEMEGLQTVLCMQGLQEDRKTYQIQG